MSAYGSNLPGVEFASQHDIGSGKCDGCWPGYPRRCECGGMIHAEFGDEMEDGYYLNFYCDKCGSTAGQEDGYYLNFYCDKCGSTAGQEDDG